MATAGGCTSRPPRHQSDDKEEAEFQQWGAEGSDDEDGAAALGGGGEEDDDDITEAEVLAVYSVVQPAVQRLLTELQGILEVSEGRPPTATELAAELDSFTTLIQLSNDPAASPPAQQGQERGRTAGLETGEEGGARRSGFVPVAAAKSRIPVRRARPVRIPLASEPLDGAGQFSFATPQKREHQHGGTPSSSRASSWTPTGRTPTPEEEEEGRDLRRKAPIRSPVFDDVDSPQGAEQGDRLDYQAWKGAAAEPPAELAQWRAELDGSGEGEQQQHAMAAATAVETEQAGDGESAEASRKLAEEEAFWRGVAEASQEGARMHRAAAVVQSHYRQWRRVRRSSPGRLGEEQRASGAPAAAKAAEPKIAEMADKYIQRVREGQEVEDLEQLAVGSLLLSIVVALTTLCGLLLAMYLAQQQAGGAAGSVQAQQAGQPPQFKLVGSYLRQAYFDYYFPDNGRALTGVAVAVAATSIGVLVC